MSIYEPNSATLLNYFLVRDDDDDQRSYSDNVEVVKIPKLEEVLSTLENPYCCWGKLKEDISKVRLFIDSSICGTLEKPNIDKIRSLSKPTSSGFLSLSRGVKADYQVEGDRIRLVRSLGCVTDIVPLPYPVELKGKECLYKIHLSEKSEKTFQIHYETPKRKIYFGTLLICLPTEFEGGELVISSVSGEETRLGCRHDAKGKVETWWTFLFTDTKHVFEPVSSGSRVILQCDIFFDKTADFRRVELVDHEFHYEQYGNEDRDNTSVSLPKQYKSDYMSLDSTLKSQVKNAKINARQSKNLVEILKYSYDRENNLGICLSHMYPLFAERESVLLRGRDRLLYNSIMEIKSKLPEMRIVFKYLINEQEQPRDLFNMNTESYILEPAVVEFEVNKRSPAELTTDLVDEETLKDSDAWQDSLNEITYHPYKRSDLVVADHPGAYFKEIVRKNSQHQFDDDEVIYVSCVLIVEFFKPSPRVLRNRYVESIDYL